MLGQLLHSFNPSRRGGSLRQSNNLIESVTEDSHTRNLLFPDAAQLFQSDGNGAQAFPLAASGSPGGSGTYDGTQAGIDLDQARDFRVIIAQDEAGPMPRTVLFDSKPGSSDSGPTASSERRGSRGLFGASSLTQPAAPSSSSAFTSGHGRRSSLAVQGSEPRSPTVSAFQRARTRGASISTMSNIEEASISLGRSKESEELIKTCLECMFGNTPMSYRGPSNKLHIIPLEPRQMDRSIVTSPTSEGFNSLGKAEGRKRSSLATSYTPSSIPSEPSHSANSLPEASHREARRRTILITRTFSVQPPDEVEMPDSASLKTPTPGSSLGKGNQFPFPTVNAQGQYSSLRGAKHQPRRTPMYAITIILHLPVASSNLTVPASRSGPGGQKPGAKSQGGQDSLGSSFDSERRAGWTYVDSTFGVDSLLSTASNSDVDDRVDVVGQHWDVITRTLTSLQFIVQEKVMNMFKATDLATPTLQPLPVQRTQDGRGIKREIPMSMQMPPRRVLKLQQHALLFDNDIKQAVEAAGERVVRGMKVPRVVTGQGRWGVWREEARWLGRWAGGREQNFFLFNLLTAFLGTHTEWLNVLAPKSYRVKHREHQKMNAGEDITIAARTVIVSADKMAARRLIFLLATFLPASTHTGYDGASPVRPSTSASFRGYSQSPPSNAAVSRQQSLRRTINRRGHKSYPNISVLNVGKGPNKSLEALDSSEDKSEDGKSDSANCPPNRSTLHSRRPSQVHSIKSINNTGLTIPSMAEDAGVRKGSPATTSTVTPETAVPVAHFAVQRTNSSSMASSEPRPPSSGSLASVNLRQNLQRNGTNTTGSPSTDSHASRWGSFMSFWSSGRRESSAETSDVLQSTDDGLSAAPGYRRPVSHQSPNKLQQMVDELQIQDLPDTYPWDLEENEVATAQTGAEQSTSGSEVGHTAARAIPARHRPGGPLESPLKLSINESDGIIDVDIPLPGFGSPLRSPLLPTLGDSVSSLEGTGSSFGPSAFSSHLSLDSLGGFSSAQQPPVNVAGWLARFHQDFALQGVSPYAELEKDIRKAMSAEPTPITAAATPSLENGPTEKWVHVCSVLVADARTFTVKRISLKRLVRLIPSPAGQPAITPGPHSLGHYGHGPPGPTTPGLGRSQYGNPYTVGSAGSLAPALPMTELKLEEKFVVEPVMDLDETLVDALERGLGLGGLSAAASPAIHSHAHSHSQALAQAQAQAQANNNANASSGSSTITAATGTTQSQSQSQSQSQQRPSAPDPTSSSASASASAPAPSSSSTTRIHSSTPSSSRSSSRRGRRDNRTGSDAASTITALEVPARQECRALVLGALEAVVRSVAAERVGGLMGSGEGVGVGAWEGGGGSGGGNGNGSVENGGSGGRAQMVRVREGGGVVGRERGESTLREGVRRWLGMVEDGW